MYNFWTVFYSGFIYNFVVTWFVKLVRDKTCSPDPSVTVDLDELYSYGNPQKQFDVGLRGRQILYYLL